MESYRASRGPRLPDWPLGCLLLLLGLLLLPLWGHALVEGIVPRPDVYPASLCLSCPLSVCHTVPLLRVLLDVRTRCPPVFSGGFIHR
jgi:hypothetical protein